MRRDDDASIDEWVHHDPVWIQRLFRVITGWWWTVGFRHRFYGSANVPVSGGVLLACNHASYADPFLTAHGQRRNVRFMAKSQLFDMPVVGKVVTIGGAFPVRRGEGDAWAIDAARAMLADGQAVIVYPEGTRFRKEAALGPARRGAARLALEAGVPIVPVAIYGTKPRAARGLRRWWPALPRVTTLYGEPMHFDGVDPTSDDVARVRDEVWREVQRLYALAEHLTVGRLVRPLRFAVPPRSTSTSATR